MTSLRLAAATIVAAMTLVPAAAEARSPSAHQSVVAAACVGADLIPTASNLATIRSATVCLLNAERVDRGRAALRTNRDLTQAAGNYARAMVGSHFFAHVSPTGSTLVTRVKQTAYLARTGGWSLGENLAWGELELGSPGRTVEAWMNSAPHRRNILDSRFVEIGVGLAYGTPSGGQDPGATYATEFGSRSLLARR